MYFWDLYVSEKKTYNKSCIEYYDLGTINWKSYALLSIKIRLNIFVVYNIITNYKMILNLE